MVRRVYFSFDFDRDIWRVCQIRNSWVTRGIEEAGYIDSASWEKVRKSDDATIERWINNQLDGTSVTVVLIGAETYESKWVKYEIKKSYTDNKGMLGIYIHNVKDSNKRTDFAGRNPFDAWKVGDKLLSTIYPTYDWELNNGYDNIGNWIEDAAKKAGR